MLICSFWRYQHFHWLTATETEARTVANGNVKLLWQVCNKPRTQVADRFNNFSAKSKFITFHPEEGTSASASDLCKSMPQLRRRADVNLVLALEGKKVRRFKIHHSGIGYVCKKFHAPFMSKSQTIHRITSYLSGISRQDKWTGGFNIKGLLLV